MRGLSGKVILVTGLDGIGFAMAERLIAEGAKVLIHGRDATEVDAAGELGTATAGATGDLAEPATAQAIVDATTAAFGRIDGLVNNAGIYPRGILGETTAAFSTTCSRSTPARRCFAPKPLSVPSAPRSPGAIVTVGSINAYCGLSNLTVYSMSKGAL